MHRISKSTYIDMAHRIRGHKGKCSNLHGHSWKIELSLSSAQLNDLGMVVDFAEISKFFDEVVQPFDHHCLLGKKDFEACLEGGIAKRLNVAFDTDSTGIRCAPVNILTAETLAMYIFDRARERWSHPIRVEYVRVYEKLHPTESYAEHTEK